MNSFMSWIGGKKALRDEIIARFPLDYSRYIEVFGGGGHTGAAGCSLKMSMIEATKAMAKAMLDWEQS